MSRDRLRENSSPHRNSRATGVRPSRSLLSVLDETSTLWLAETIETGTLSDFDGQTAVVAGAGSGIGRAAAHTFAAREAAVTVTDINREAGNKSSHKN